MSATFKLNLPNDYQSEEDSEAAFQQAYGEDAEDFRGDADAANRMYEPIADAASGAGLKYVEESTYGAIWKGTAAQFAACIEELPGWAKRYASKIEK
jgi:hypothetical protein